MLGTRCRSAGGLMRGTRVARPDHGVQSCACRLVPPYFGRNRYSREAWCVVWWSPLHHGRVAAAKHWPDALRALRMRRQKALEFGPNIHWPGGVSSS